MKSTFFFSRIRLNQNVSYSDKGVLLYDGVDSKFNIEFRKDLYKFINSDYIKEGNDQYVIGEMIKYKPEFIEKYLDEETNSEAERRVTNKILSKVRFIIHPESGIIVYEEDKSYIPSDTFPTIFNQLFEKNSDPEKNILIDLSPLTEPNDFFERIEKIAKIKKIEIKLVPSNPSSRDLWDDIDKSLHERGITNYKEIQENKKLNGSIEIDEETKQKMHMSEDGYGLSTVEGLDSEGSPVKFSTKDADVQVKQRVETSNLDFRQLIAKLKDKIFEIKNRF